MATLLACPTLVLAGPTGGEIVGGAGSINQINAATTQVRQLSQAMAVNWQTFNVSAQEIVKFVQPNAQAIALNRILDQNPSQIFGQLQANGTVFLVNPHGVMFGETAQVSVGSLMATSLDINPDDFMAGRYNFVAGATPGAVINHGMIAAATGGSVVLAGGQVINTGLIQASYGRVTLAGADAGYVDFDGDGLMRFEVTGELKQKLDGADAAVVNSGTIQAASVIMEAAAAKGVFDNLVNNEGLINATGIDTSGGEVRLVAVGGNVVNSGTIDVSSVGGQAGTVVISATGGNIINTGTIKADSTAAQAGSVKLVADGGDIGVTGTITAQSAGNADGGVIELNATGDTIVGSVTSGATVEAAVLDTSSVGGLGGTIEVEGERVAVAGPSRLGSNGGLGGGTVFIGGGLRGSNTLVRNASQTYVGADARISADALNVGRGGLVVVWSENYTAFYGTVSARGPPGAIGNGGFVEVSGEVLSFAGSVDAASLLLDPNNLFITAGATCSLCGGGASEDTTNPFNDANSGTKDSWVQKSTLEGLASNVAVTLAATGDIVFETSLSMSASSGSITLTAGNAIAMAGFDVTTAGGALTLNAGAGGVTNIGSINTNGGLLTINAGGTSTQNSGDIISGNGGLTKSGTGTLTLSQANTYTGATTINDGTLQSSGGAIPDASAVVMANTGSPILRLLAADTIGSLTDASNAATNAVVNLQGFTLTTGGNNSSTSFNGAITGTGNLTKSGNGTFTLLGGTNNTYSGTTTVATGTLVEGAADQLANGSSLVVSGGTFDLGGFSDTVAGVQLTGGTIQNGTLTSTTAFDLENGIVSGVLAGSVGVTKSTTSTVQLSGANQYTGVTAVDAGTLVLVGNAPSGANGTLGNATSTVTVGSAGNAASLLIGGAFSVDRNITIQGDTTTALGGSGGSFTGTITLNNNVTLKGSGTVTYSGIISGAGSLTKIEAGTAILSAANSYAGATTINDGTLRLGAADVIPDGAAKGDVTVSSPGTLDLNGFSETINGLLGNGTVDTNGSATLTVGNNDATSSFSGVIKNTAGTLALTKTGTGQLTLSGTNTYSGLTTVSGGTLVAASNSALGATTNGTTVSSGATLTLSSATIGAEGLSLNGNGVGGNGALTATGTSSLSGTVTLAGASRIGGGSALTLSGTISGAGLALDLALTGGSITLGGDVTLGGLTTGTGSFNVSLAGSTNSIGGNTAFTNTGTVTIGDANTDAFTFAGGLDTSSANVSNTHVAGSIATTNSALKLGAATLDQDTALNAGSATLTLAAVTGGARALTLTADEIDLGGAISGTGAIILQPANAGTAVNIAGADSGSGTTLDLLSGELDQIANNHSSITLGSASGTALVTVSAYQFKDPVTLRNGSGGITVSGAITTIPGEATSVSFNTTGALTLNASVTTASVSAGPTAGDDTAVTGDINVTAGSVTGDSNGKLVTGDASVDTSATGTDSATSGSISLTVTGAIQMAAASQALKVGTATATGTLPVGTKTSTGGSITITSASRVASNGTNGQLDLVIGAASGGTSSTGSLSVTTTGAAGDAGGIFIKSAGALQLGVIATGGGSQNVTISTAGQALTLNNSNESLSGDNVTFDAGAGTFTMTPTVFNNSSSAFFDIGTGTLTLSADDMVLPTTADTIQGAGGTLVIQPGQGSTGITIAGAAASTLQLSTSEIGSFKDGFTSITIGRSDSSAATTIPANVSFKDDLTIYGGSISSTGTLSDTTSSVTLRAIAGDITDAPTNNTSKVTAPTITLIASGSVGGTTSQAEYDVAGVTTLSVTAGSNLLVRSSDTTVLQNLSVTVSPGTTFGTVNSYSVANFTSLTWGTTGLKDPADASGTAPSTTSCAAAGASCLLINGIAWTGTTALNLSITATNGNIVLNDNSDGGGGTDIAITLIKTNNGGGNITITALRGNIYDGNVGVADTSITNTGTANLVTTSASTIRLQSDTDANSGNGWGGSVGSGAANSVTDIDISGTADFPCDASTCVISTDQTLTGLSPSGDPRNDASFSYAYSGSNGTVSINQTCSSGNSCITANLTTAGFDLQYTALSGDIYILDAGITTNGGDVTLIANLGGIYRSSTGNSAPDINTGTGGNVVLTAFTAIGASAVGGAITTQIVNLAAQVTGDGTVPGTLGCNNGVAVSCYGNAADGSLYVSETGSVALNAITLLSGTAVISATQALTYLSGNVSATAVSLTAGTSLGTAGTPLQVSTTSLTLNAGTTFNVDDLTATKDLATLAVTATSGIGGTSDVTASNLTFDAAASSGVTTLTNVIDTTGLNFSYTATSGDLKINTITVTGGTNSVALAASAGKILDDEAGLAQTTRITSSSVSLTASSDIGAAGTDIDTATGTLSATSTSGPININEVDGLTELALNAGTGSVTLTAGGDIASGDVGLDIVGGAVSISTTGKIGGTSTAAGNAIEIQASTLALTSGGDIFVTSPATLVVNNLQTAAGANTVGIATTSAGNLTLNGLYTNVSTDAFSLNSAGTLTFATNAPTVGSLSGTAAGTITANVNLTTSPGTAGTSGGITLVSTGGALAGSSVLTTGTADNTGIGNTGAVTSGAISVNVAGAIPNTISFVTGAASGGGTGQKNGGDITLQAGSVGAVGTPVSITLGDGTSLPGKLNLNSTGGAGVGGFYVSSASQILVSNLTFSAANALSLATSGGNQIYFYGTGSYSGMSGVDLLVNASGTAAFAVDMTAHSFDVTGAAINIFANLATAANGSGSTGGVTLNATSGSILSASSGSVSTGNASTTSGSINATASGSITHLVFSTGTGSTSGNINLTATSGSIGSPAVTVNTGAATTSGRVNLVSNGGMLVNTSTGAVIGNLDSGNGFDSLSFAATGTANLTFASGATYTDLGTDSFSVGMQRGTLTFGTDLTVNSISITSNGTTAGEGDVVVNANLRTRDQTGIVDGTFSTISVTTSVSGGSLTGTGSLQTGNLFFQTDGVVNDTARSGAVTISTAEEIEGVTVGTGNVTWSNPSSLAGGDTDTLVSGSITLTSRAHIGTPVTPVVVRLGTTSFSNPQSSTIVQQPGNLSVAATAAAGGGNIYVRTNGVLRLNSLVTGSGTDTIVFSTTSVTDDFIILAPLTSATLAGDSLSFIATGDPAPSLNSFFTNDSDGVIGGPTSYQNINVGTGTLTIKADQIDLGGTIVASGGVSVGPVDNGSDIGLGNAVADFNLTNATLVTLANAGGGSLTITSTGTGADIFIDGVDFTSVNSGAGGSLTLVSAATIQGATPTFASDFVTTATGSFTLTSNGPIGAAVNGVGQTTFANETLTVAAGTVTVLSSGGNDVNIYRPSGFGGAYDTTVNIATGGAGAIKTAIYQGAFNVGSIATTGTVYLINFASGTGVYDVFNDAGVDVRGSSIEIDSNAAVGSSSATLDLAGTTIRASSNAGGIFLSNDSTLTGPVTVSSLSASGGGNIVFAQSGGQPVTFTAVTTNADATPVAGESDITLSNTGGTLTATLVTANGLGDVSLQTLTSGDITLGRVTALADTVTVDSAGAITDGLAGEGSGFANVSAADAVFSAANGIGSSDSIDTAIDTLTATNTASGDIQFTELDAVSALSLHNLVPDDNDFSTGRIVLSTINGTITVAAAGSGVSTIDGALTLDANGQNSDVLVNAPIQIVNSDATSGDTWITLRADDSIQLAVTGDITGSGGIPDQVRLFANDDSSTVGNSGDGIVMAESGADVATIDAGAADIMLQASGTAGGNIVIGRLITSSTSTTAVTITTSGAVIDNGDFGGNDIDAPNGRIVIAAATGIGSSNPLEINADSLDAQNSTSGNIDLRETDGVIVAALQQANVANTTGTVRLISDSGDIALLDGAVVSRGGLITLTATAGGITDGDGGATVSITNTAGTGGLALNADSGIGNGDPLELNVLALSAVNTTGGDIQLVQPSGSLTIGLSGTGVTNSGGNIVLTTSANSLTIAENIDSGAARTTLTAGDQIIANFGSEIVTANELVLSAVNGISSGCNSCFNLAVNFLQATNGSNGIEVNNTGDITLADITGLGYAISNTNGGFDFENTGSITVADQIITGRKFALSAQGLASDLLVNANITGGTLSAAFASSSLSAGHDILQLTGTTVAAGLQNLSLNAASVASLAAVSSNGTVQITANSIADNNGVANNVTANLLNASAAAGIDLDTDIAFLTASNTTSGDINITDTNDGFSVNTVSAPGQTVTLDGGAGAITDNNGAANNITASLLDVTAATGIDLDVAINTLTADNTVSGSINIADGNGFAINTVQGQTVTLDSASGAFTDNNADAAGADTTVNITATTLNLIGGAAVTSIETAVSNLSLVTAATSITNTGTLTLLDSTVTGTLNLSNDSDIALNGLNAGSQTVVLTSGGAITDNNGAGVSNVIAGSVTFDSVNGVGTAAAPIDTTVDTITATASADGGVYIHETNGATISSINIGNDNDANDVIITSDSGNLLVGTILIGPPVGPPEDGATASDVTLTATLGSIQDDEHGDLNLDIEGDVITLDGHTGVGDVDPLELLGNTYHIDGHTGGVGINDLGAGTTTPLVLNSTGNITYGSNGNIFVGQVVSSGGDVLIQSFTGYITDDADDATLDIQGNHVTLIAPLGVGGYVPGLGADQFLEIDSNTLTAQTSDLGSETAPILLRELSADGTILGTALQPLQTVNSTITVVNPNGGLEIGNIQAPVLVLNAAGNLTDGTTGDVSVTGNASLTGANITIGDAAPATAHSTSFGTLTFTSAGAVTILQDTDVVLEGPSSALSLVLGSAGTIDDGSDGGLAITNNASFSGTSVTLGNDAGNSMAFGTLTFNSSGAVDITEGSAIDFAGASTAGSVTLKSVVVGGGIDPTNVDTGTIQTTGTTTLIAGSNDINLDDSNQFGTVVISSANNVSLKDVDVSGIDLGASSVTGTLTVVASGPITDSGVVSVGSNASFKGTDITLNNGDDFSTLTFDGSGTVDITEADSMDLAGTNKAGTLVLTSIGAGGGIDDGATSTLTVTGTTKLTAGTNNIALDNVANDFQNPVQVVSATDASLADVDTLTLSSVSIAGNLTLNAAVLGTQTGAISASGLELLGGSYSLTNIGNAVGTIAANTSGTISYVNSGDLSVGGVNGTTGITTTGQDVSLQTLSAGALDPGALSIDQAIALGAGNLTLNSADVVFQGAPITAAGLALLGTGPFDLTDPNNDVGTIAANTTEAISYTDTNALAIGTVNGVPGITTTNDDVTLGAGSLTIGPLSIGSGTFGLTSGVAVDLGGLSLPLGSLSVTAPGITGTTAVVVGGTTTLDAMGLDIVLTNGSNDFSTVVINGAHDVQLSDVNALTLGDVLTSNDLTVNATTLTFDGFQSVGHDLNIGTQLAPVTSVSQASGELDVTATTNAFATGDIILDSLFNDFGGQLNASSTTGKLAFGDSNDISLGALSSAGETDLIALGNITDSSDDDLLPVATPGRVNITAPQVYVDATGFGDSTHRIEVDLPAGAPIDLVMHGGSFFLDDVQEVDLSTVHPTGGGTLDLLADSIVVDGDFGNGSDIYFLTARQTITSTSASAEITASKLHLDAFGVGSDGNSIGSIVQPIHLNLSASDGSDLFVPPASSPLPGYGFVNASNFTGTAFSNIFQASGGKVFVIANFTDLIASVQGSFITAVNFTVDASQFKSGLNIFGIEGAAGFLLPWGQCDDEESPDCAKKI